MNQKNVARARAQQSDSGDCFVSKEYFSELGGPLVVKCTALSFQIRSVDEVEQPLFVQHQDTKIV